MKESKGHLNIDLEFLDKKESLSVPRETANQVGGTPRTPALKPINRKYNWKSVLIIGLVILFFTWIGSSDSGISSAPSSNSGYTPLTNNNDLTTGKGQVFRCSDSNYNKALKLKPDSVAAASVSSESDTLDSRSATIDALSAKIDAMYVDQTNKVSLDRYNAAVDNFNSLNNLLRSDIDRWNKRNTALNSQIRTYNNFLDTNCTPR